MSTSLIDKGTSLARLVQQVFIILNYIQKNVFSRALSPALIDVILSKKKRVNIIKTV